MPQDRILLHSGDAWRVERVSWHPAPAHWSPSYEVPTRRLVLPASGATEFLAAGQTLLLDGLTALCLPTGQPYRMKPCAGVARSSIVVSAQPGKQAGAVLPRPDAWVLAPRVLWGLRRHWRALALGREVGEPTPALLQAALLPAHRAVPGEGRSWAAVQRARHFMAVRAMALEETRWTLDDVADAACCSLFHLARLFRRHTGMSLHGYRQRLRLAAALQRLEEGERDLAALAHDLGYSSQSHLGAVFRRELGVTPAQARLELAG
jgi:AraC-like DNA-binding protein